MTTIIDSYRLKPKNPIKNIKKYDLDGLDKNNYFYSTIYFGYSSNNYPETIKNYEDIIKKIENDLSILQNIFPMVSGNIDYKYKENKAEVICDCSGVMLIKAENNNINITDLSILKDNNDIKSSETIHNMFTPDIEFIKNKYNVNHFPLLVQVTKLKCNSVILTLIFSHMLMDGNTHEIFQKAWKSVSQNLEVVGPSEKKLDYNTLDKYQSVMPKGWIEIEKKLLFNNSNKNSQSVPSSRFHFSKYKINKLKVELNNEIKKLDESKYVTTDEAICSILWKSVIKARKLSKDRITTFIRPTNIRKIISPQLPDNSVGNLAIMHGISLRCKELLNSKQIEIIKEIQLQKKRYTNDKILQNLKYFKKLNHDKSLVMDFIGLNDNDIFINSWSKFYSLSSFDIGFGNNIFVCLPPVMSGLIVLVPNCFNQKEGIIAHIYLQEILLKELQNDKDLLKYLY
jgi:hypothetical protein